jgi:hypothetical protein
VLIHLAAVPVALLLIWSDHRHVRQTLLAGLYLAWIFQAVVLQHLFDYIHVPAILLGLTVVFSQAVVTQRAVLRFGLVLFVLVGLFVQYPAVYGRRLDSWDRSVSEKSTADLRDRLTLSGRVNWSDLEQVREFLVRQNVRDGEVTCFSMRTVPLYDHLGLQPSTPYLFLHNCLALFPRQRDRIHADLAASRQRYVVCDLFGLRDKSGKLIEGDPMPVPSIWQPASRWGDKIVFRAGRYVVFAIDGMDMPDWLDESFHL